MKKFILLFVGYSKPTKEVRDAWMQWFEGIKEHIVDSGNPFGSVKEVTSSEIRELPHDKNAMTGYTIIKAKDIAQAVEIAKTCPVVTGIRVYEATSM